MSAPEFLVLALARWTQFIALFLLFGGLLFPFYAIPAAARSSATPMRASAQKAFWYAGFAQVVSVVAWLAATIASMGDGWDALADANLLTTYLTETGSGHVWLVRLLLTLALAAILTIAKPSLFERNGISGAALALSGFLLASQAGAGHPAAMEDDLRAIVQVGYALHVLGAAAWIGGLCPLLALLLAARGNPHQHGIVALVLERFAVMATFAVAMVVIGGVINAWIPLKTSSFSWTSTWSVTLTAKIILFLMLLVVGVHNRYRLGPQMASSPAGATAKIFRNVALDHVLALGVLFAAAVLGLLSPDGS